MILVSLALKEQCHCIFSTRVHEYSKVMWDSLHCARNKPNSGFYGNQHNQLKLLYYVDKMYEPCAPDECLKNTKEYSSCKITNLFQLQNHKYFSCNFKVQKIPARVKKKLQLPDHTSQSQVISKWKGRTIFGERSAVMRKKLNRCQLLLNP